MSLVSLDLWVMGLFLVLFLGIAFYFTRKANTLQNYFLGGRNLSWLVLGTSMVATTFAADTPLAVTELVAQSGISGNWLWWNMLAGGMLTTIFFARYWRRAGILTDVELIKLRYSGREAAFLRVFKAAYMGLFLNVLIIGWVNVALMTLIEVFFGVDREISLFITGAAMLIVILYSTAAGLLGIVYTDVIQFITAMTGSIILAVIVLNDESIGGVAGLKSQLPASSLDFFPRISDGNITQTLSLGLGSFLAYATIQWWASWYPGNEPGGGGYIAQRMMSAKNEKHAIYSSLFFQIAHYCIRPWPWIIVALASLVLYPDLADPKTGYVMIMRDYLPDGLRGLLLVSFLAAYMSTISTQLNWGASYLVNDFYEPLSGQKAGSLLARFATVLIAMVGLAVTTQIESISSVWKFLMECGAGLGLVLILRWYWWRINAWSEIVATLAPFLGYSIARFGLGMEFPNSFFVTVGFTTVAWLLVTLVTKPTDDSVLSAFVDRVRPAGAWRGMSESRVTWQLPVLWISGILMAYSVLFLAGEWFLGLNANWLVYLVTFVLSSVTFVALLSREVSQ